MTPFRRMVRVVASVSRIAWVAVVCAVAWAPSATADPAVPVTICGVVLADAEPSDERSILEFLRGYESTLASGRVERIASLYANFDGARRAQVTQYFTQVVSDFNVRLQSIRVVVRGDAAEVSFDRTDSFTDRETRTPVEKSVQIDRRLERVGASWRMVLDRSS